MTTPFVAFERPDLSTVSPETLATGLLLGSGIGSVVPMLALSAELLGGASLANLTTTPSPALLVSFVAPAIAGAVGAWLHARVTAHRQAYEAVATKAGTLLDETWELREQLDAQPVPDAPPLSAERRTELASDDRMLEGGLTDRTSASESDALIQAQSLLLQSVGQATRDAIRRMRIHVHGLELTPLSVVQGRLVQSLSGHLEGLGELAQDVVEYAEEDQTQPPRPQRSGRARTAA